MYNLQLKTPFTSIISGGTGAGKTHLLYNILRFRRALFDVPPQKVILFYAMKQDIYDSMLRTGAIDEMVQGIPDSTDLENMLTPYSSGAGCVIIFDDQMNNITDDLQDIFTQIGHHQKCSVFFLSQNLFFRSTKYRTMTLNTHYLFVMKSVAATSQVITLAKHFSPYQTNYIIKGFQDATKSPYKYMLFDFHPSTPDHIRIRTNILPYEWPMWTYMQANANIGRKRKRKQNNFSSKRSRFE